MENMLEIDFGTTNSAMCATNHYRREQIWNYQRTGEYIYSSFVENDDKGVAVGYSAKWNMGRPGHFVVSCVKRIIGQIYDDYLKLDEKDIIGRVVVGGEDGYPYFIANIDGTKKCSCINVACMLIKWLKETAE